MTEEEREASGWSWGAAQRAATIAGVSLLTGGVLGYSVVHEPHGGSAPQRVHDRPKAGAAEQALVAPLREGAPLDGFTIEQIHPLEQGLLNIDFLRGSERVRLSISLARADSPFPPASTGPYAIYYSGREAASESGAQLARALAEVVGKNLAVSPPPGLSAFPSAPSPPSAASDKPPP